MSRSQAKSSSSSAPPSQRQQKKFVCPALVPSGSQIRDSTSALTWRIGRQIGEGTFSRIYDISPLTNINSHNTSSLPQAIPPSYPCVLKVNKVAPPQADPNASFRFEYEVWKSVQERQVQKQRTNGVPPHIPLAVSHNPLCSVDTSAASSSSSSSLHIEYLILERCGVDFSALRDAWKQMQANRPRPDSADDDDNGPSKPAGGEVLAGLQFGLLALRALEEFHSCGYVHRDIKPSNFLSLLPSHPERHQRILVTDFGLSRTRAELDAHPDGHASHRTIGKSLYASFTSHKHSAQTPRDDIISLMFVMLDCMYGKLPWMELSNGKWNGDGSKKSPEQRWADVAKMKERLLGSFPCQRTADREEEEEFDWLIDETTGLAVQTAPREIRLIFHLLHQSKHHVDYAEIRNLLERIRKNTLAAGETHLTLAQILDTHAASEEKEMRAIREKEEKERRKEEEKTRKMQAKQEAAAAAAAAIRTANEAKANEAKAKAAASAAAAQAKAAEPKPLPPPPPPTIAASSSAASHKPTPSITSLQSQTSSLRIGSQAQPTGPRSLASTGPSFAGLSSTSNLAPKPKPFNELSTSVRILLGKAMYIDWSIQKDMIDLTSLSSTSDTCTSRTAIGHSTTHAQVARFEYSLDRYWDDVNWAQVQAAAIRRTRVGTVVFDQWNGDWNTLIQGLHSLSPKQYESLLQHLLSQHASFPIPMKPRLMNEEMIKNAIPAGVAYIFNVMQKAKNGVPKIAGFGATAAAPVTNTPAAISKTTGTATATATAAKSAASATNKSAAPPINLTKSPAARVIPKKGSTTAAQTSTIDDAPASPVTAPSKSTSASKKARRKEREEKKAAKKEKKKMQASSSKKKKKIESSSDSELSNSSSSSASSESDDDDEVLVTKSAVEKEKKPEKPKPEPSAKAKSLPPSPTKKRAQAAVPDDEPSEESDDDDDDDQDEVQHITPRRKFGSDNEDESEEEEEEEVESEEARNKRLMGLTSRQREYVLLQEEKERAAREDKKRLARQAEVARALKAELTEAKKQQEARWEQEEYEATEEDILPRFNSGLLATHREIDEIKNHELTGNKKKESRTIPQEEFALPRHWVQTPEERAREKAARDEDYDIVRYENVNDLSEFKRMTKTWLERKNELNAEETRRVAKFIKAEKDAELAPFKEAEKAEKARLKVEQAAIAAAVKEEKERQKALDKESGGRKKKKKTVEEELAFTFVGEHSSDKAARAAVQAKMEELEKKKNAPNTGVTVKKLTASNTTAAAAASASSTATASSLAASSSSSPSSAAGAPTSSSTLPVTSLPDDFKPSSNTPLKVSVTTKTNLAGAVKVPVRATAAATTPSKTMISSSNTVAAASSSSSPPPTVASDSTNNSKKRTASEMNATSDMKEQEESKDADSASSESDAKKIKLEHPTAPGADSTTTPSADTAMTSTASSAPTSDLTDNSKKRPHEEDAAEESGSHAKKQDRTER